MNVSNDPNDPNDSNDLLRANRRYNSARPAIQPMASKLQIEERQVEDVTVLVLAGEMVLDDGDLAFKRRVDALLGRNQVKILVDLAAVTQIDSSSVGMMVAQLKTVQRRGGDIRLLRLSPRGQRLFGLLKLRSTFETYDDEALAVRSFALRPGAP
jgi:anti-sigma B factor antagonist